MNVLSANMHSKTTSLRLLITGRSIGFGLLLLVLLFALGEPLVTGVSPTAQSLMHALQPPSFDAFLGYDHLGRSMSARLSAALRLSLGIATATLITTAFIGVV